MGVIAAISVTMVLPPSPAEADFTITKQNAQSKPGKARPSRTKPSRSAKPNLDGAVPAPAPLTGIDPALMYETVTEAGYTATLSRDQQARTALIEATDGKSGWSVNLTHCIGDNHCRAMEFYTLWRVANEANVCTVWGNDVARDPTRGMGKPFCYTVPELPKQFHLKLSSDQTPYSDLGKLTRDEAKAQMRSMIEVWENSLPMLQEAWKRARKKCPRVSDRCT